MSQSIVLLAICRQNINPLWLTGHFVAAKKQSFQSLQFPFPAIIFNKLIYIWIKVRSMEWQDIKRLSTIDLNKTFEKQTQILIK